MLKEYSPKKSSCRDKKSHSPILLSLALFALMSITLGTAVAEDKPAVADPGEQTEGERIHVTSDRLIVEPGSDTAEFIGNVNATQDRTSITSDRLKIFYKSEGEGDEATGSANAKLMKIVADGHVTIKLDDQVAVTDKAVYITETEVLILTGPNSKLTSEKNSVSGDKITLYRLDNRMIVDGSGKERVEAILYTKDKGIK